MPNIITCALLGQLLDSGGQLLTTLGYGLWPGMVLLSEIVQTFILSDFCYYYVKRWVVIELLILSSKSCWQQTAISLIFCSWAISQMNAILIAVPLTVNLFYAYPLEWSKFKRFSVQDQQTASTRRKIEHVVTCSFKSFSGTAIKTMVESCREWTVKRGMFSH